MIDARSQRTFDEFVARTLPKTAWTHRAHLVVCWVTLANRNVEDAIVFLRHGIRTYNEATGVSNTPTSGYHETLTQYYVQAVAALNAPTIDDVVAAPTCRVDAPAQHWTHEVLFSSEARAGWVEPDLGAVSWRKSAASGASRQRPRPASLRG